MIRIAIADEQPIVRWALGVALGKTADFSIVGQAGSLDDMLELVRRVKPDVLVLDPALGGSSGFDALAKLNEIEAGPFVVVLSAIADVTYAARAMRAGAHAYISKAAAPEQLDKAIRSVVLGVRVAPAGVERLLAKSPELTHRGLSVREQQVLEMLARGMTSREISEQFGISIKTVDTHRSHVLEKLGLRNNAELTRYAVKHGYVTL